MSRDSDSISELGPVPHASSVTERSGSAQSGFVRPIWFDMLARHCFAGQKVVMQRASFGSASVILPLVERSDRLTALANYYSFTFGPLFQGTGDQAVRSDLLGALAADLRTKHHRISLYPLVGEEGAANLLRRAFAGAGWIAMLTGLGVNHVLNVEGRNFAAYWAERPGALRSSVSRKGRSDRYRFEVHSALTEPLWQDYLAVYGASWKNAEPYPLMIREIAQEAASRGVLRLGFARENENPVAVQLWTIESETACIHKLAHDKTHDQQSPGTLLSHHMFAHMIDIERVARIDYGTGGNAYKADWMEEQRPMLRLDCFDPRRAAMWLPALKTRISQLVHRPTWG